MNMNDAVTHHLAVLGVTGTGKSVFARNLIKNIVNDETNVICVDFTNEYKDKFADYGCAPIVSEESEQDLFQAIDILSRELDKFPNQQSPQVISKQEKILQDGFYKSIKEFLKSDRKVSLFELPDVSNTTSILEYTK